MLSDFRSKARVENIEEFLSVTKNFDDTSDGPEEETGLDKLSRFLNDLALIADTDSGSQETSEVTLMTLHAAKGLEFQLSFWLGWKKMSFRLAVQLKIKMNWKKNAVWPM